ncbi:MAG: ParB/RepB/Spo0J family partition protein [Hydrogenophilus sp.]|nr:ParB/RepB/Spo0J family partition protein [Hydrogenophilus sp.]
MSRARGKGLGRGLAALLGDDPTAPAADEPLRWLAVEALVPGRFQPRTHFDAESLTQLADSMRTHGILQPLVVRPIDEERFEIVAGERRWRAAQLAGLAQVPCVVRRLTDNAALALALVENVQREELNPIELAEALARLTEEFGMSHQQVAEALGVSRAQVSNVLRLRHLEASVREWVAKGALEMGHARALLALPAEEQRRVAAQAVAGGWSVRRIEAEVQRHVAPPPPRTRRGERLIEWQRLEEQLSKRLTVPVRVERGRGYHRLVVPFRDLEELDAILARLGVAFDEA